MIGSPFGVLIELGPVPCSISAGVSSFLDAVYYCDRADSVATSARRRAAL